MKFLFTLCGGYFSLNFLNTGLKSAGFFETNSFNTGRRSLRKNINKNISKYYYFKAVSLLSEYQVFIEIPFSGYN